MNSKNIGDFGEYSVITKLLEYGVEVFKPLGDNSPNDLLIVINNQYYRVQVKTATKILGYENSKYLLCPLYTSYAHRGKGKHIYTVDEVDYFIFVSTALKQFYIIENKGNRFQIRLRLDNPINNQKKGISMAKDFLLEDFLRKNGYYSVLD